MSVGTGGNREGMNDELSSTDLAKARAIAKQVSTGHVRSYVQAAQELAAFVLREDCYVCGHPVLANTEEWARPVCAGCVDALAEAAMPSCCECCENQPGDYRCGVCVMEEQADEIDNLVERLRQLLDMQAQGYDLATELREWRGNLVREAEFIRAEAKKMRELLKPGG